MNATPSNTPARANPWPHRWAVLLVVATFPLIWVGGLVTTYKAGMAVPDWPGTYGYNLFLYPLATWINGPWDLFIEHGHRLWAATVGIATIALVVSVWLQDGRRWMRLCALAALAAVIFQGMLGGMRVLLDETLLARIHGCFGPAFFAFATVLAVFTSAWWRRAGQQRAAVANVDSTPAVAIADEGVAASLVRLAWVTALLAYVQIVLGSLLRHVPVGTGPAMFRAAVWAHVLMAFVLAIHVVWLSARTLYAERRRGRLARPAAALGFLVLAQLALGAGTWVFKYGWPTWAADAAWNAGGGVLDFTVTAGSRWQAWTATLHVAIGSLILATTVMLAVRMTRLAYVARRAKAAQLRPAAVIDTASQTSNDSSAELRAPTLPARQTLTLPARPAPALAEVAL